MGKINPYLNYLVACGVGGGDQAIRVKDLTTNKVTVVCPNAAGSEVPGGPTWLDSEHVVGQLCDGTCRLVSVNIHDLSVKTLVDDGVNHCCSGGSKWSMQGLHGTYINEVLDNDKDPIVYGPDGALAYTNLAHQGLWLRNPDGSEVYLTTSVVDMESVHVLGENKVLWIESGRIRTIWSTWAVNLPGQFGWSRGVIYNGILHVMYHHYDTNKVLLHPWNSLFGWVLGPGLCYYPDINYDGLNLVATYNHVANDLPETMVAVVNPLPSNRIDLMTLLGPIVPPDPGEPPVSIPAPNKIETVKQVMRDHPEINALDELKRGKIVDYTISYLGGRPWGRKARNSDGSNKNTDGLTYLNSDGTFQIIDVIRGSDPGGTDPARFATWDTDNKNFAQGENGYWAPGEPVDSTPPNPNPVPPDSSDLEKRVTKLEQQVNTLQLANLKLQQDSLKSGDNINLQSADGFFVCAEGGGSIQTVDNSRPGMVSANRRNASAWETFKISK